MNWRKLLGDPEDFLDGKTPARRKLLNSNGGRKLPSLPAWISASEDLAGRHEKELAKPKELTK